MHWRAGRSGHDWRHEREESVLELYHNINSVCAQKVRIALKQKGQEAKDHILTLRGDQNEPGYLKLNPNGVVPTLVHDGAPIVESSLILYYIDEVFPDPPLMPKEPRLRHRVRMYNKLIDEYLHNACTILTFATAFRPNFLKMTREAWLADRLTITLDFSDRSYRLD
jgi:glutathione S-transferase